jgi:diguanylate cyclase (GGDEF)-like protein
MTQRRTDSPAAARFPAVGRRGRRRWLRTAFSARSWRQWMFSVRGRLLVSCVVLIVLLVATNLLQRHFLVEARELDEREAVQRARTQHLQSMLDEVAQLRWSSWTVYQAVHHSSAPASIEQRLAEMHQVALQLDPVLQALAEQGPEFVARLQPLLQGTGPRLDDAVARWRAGDRDGFERGRAALVSDLLDAERLLSERRGTELQSLDQLLRSRSERRERSLDIASVLVVLAAALSCAVLLLIFRQVIRPLQRLAVSLQHLRMGRLDLDLPAPRADEFGEMSLALRQFQAHAQRLDTLAYTDTLTELPNRARLDLILPELLTQHDEQATPLAMLFVGLDHFKGVNDSLGHALGDRFLHAAAARLREHLPQGALMFRYGGDLFAVLLQHPPNEPEGGSFRERVRFAAEGLLRGLTGPVPIDGNMLMMGASIGVAVYPDDASSSGELVSSADAAMFQAKSSGRGQLRFATPNLTALVRRRMLLAGEVQRGLENAEFEVFFQPIVDVSRGTVPCVEALARWRHPTRGLVMPGEFVPAAEESGAIGALGHYCLERTCAHLGRFSASGLRVRAAVNVSSRQLYNQEFAQQVAQTLAQHRIEPSRIDLEITESIMMDDPEQSARLLKLLRDQGLGLCIDDFGTGYSSLSYVQHFPIQKIKVDRSFVAQLTHSREAEAIVLATLSMARSLGLEVVAEGVESVAQMRRLYEMGCTLQQGFLFTPALPPADFEYWLETAPKRLDEISPA